MTEYELAQLLFPKDAGANMRGVTQMYGYAVSDSVDGLVSIALYSEVGGESAVMEVPTTGGITEGSDVLVTLMDGTPVDVTQPGATQAGTVAAASLPAGSTRDVSVTFQTAYGGAPSVVVGLVSSSSSSVLGACSVSVVDADANGFTARIFNASESTCNLGVSWIATPTS